MRHRAAVVAAVLAAGFAVALGGCSTSAPAPFESAGDTSQRHEEAMRLTEEADQAAQADDLKKAEELYRRSLAIAPELGATWNNLGLLLVKKQDYVGAGDMFIGATERLPSDPRPYENLGYIYHDRGHERQALEYYLKSLRVDPTHKRSLRGAIRSTQLLRLADEDALQRVKTGLMMEDDAAWVRIYRDEKFRIEGLLHRPGMPEPERPTREALPMAPR